MRLFVQNITWNSCSRIQDEKGAGDRHAQRLQLVLSLVSEQSIEDGMNSTSVGGVGAAGAVGASAPGVSSAGAAVPRSDAEGVGGASVVSDNMLFRLLCRTKVLLECHEEARSAAARVGAGVV